MIDIERQILLNQIAMIEALMVIMPVAKRGPESTVELLRKRYHESAGLLRDHSPNRT
ncbi:hypothetical protein [Bradyrhizobium sp. I71]|uniref:hypothetical protein n=1 Tax=Bradyrhizobium sp. I71 TaxID=2590772 RepID=UPI001EF83B53|nr:hypothetical protein [Bradyrhizobium sp. I71]ULK98870.1 hypothetical protein FJV43_03755 [Bradyrhizobium sp. I71]